MDMFVVGYVGRGQSLDLLRAWIFLAAHERYGFRGEGVRAKVIPGMVIPGVTTDDPQHRIPHSLRCVTPFRGTAHPL